MSLLLALLLACGGVEEESGGSACVSIRHLLSLYEGAPRRLTEPLAIEGEVVSSDRSGEFYNRLIVQDSTAGISVLIDCDTLHRLHPRGERVRIECRGLHIGAYGRSVRLGVAGTTEEVEPMSLGRWREQSLPLGTSPTPIAPRPLRIASIEAAHIATLALFEGVRFVEAGESWAERGQSKTRHLVECNSEGDTLRVRLSGYSEFYAEPIPEGRCSVVGVVDYFGDDYQLLIESPDAVLKESEF